MQYLLKDKLSFDRGVNPTAKSLTHTIRSLSNFGYL